MEENRARVNTKEKGEEHNGERGKSGGAKTRREKGKNRERGNSTGGTGKIRGAGTPGGVNKKEKREKREIGWHENTKGKGEIRVRENSNGKGEN